MSSNNRNPFFPRLDMDRIMGLIGQIESEDDRTGVKAEDHRTKVIEPKKRRRPQSVDALLHSVLNN
ncbi:hypothetical protein [Paenibacillus guangzhouensis]|uniref:hypothetical protein n=1 Tax=Paenibacillus guangzhouensis TaxID=1473112 RepID=UPI001266AAA3|nr:hypothetical protein [Paenibacillus guangzhouensis]